MARPKKGGGRVTPKGTQPTRPQPTVRPRLPPKPRVTLRRDQFAAGAAAAGVTVAEFADRAIAAIDAELARRG